VSLTRPRAGSGDRAIDAGESNDVHGHLGPMLRTVESMNADIRRRTSEGRNCGAVYASREAITTERAHRGGAASTAVDRSCNAASPFRNIDTTFNAELAELADPIYSAGSAFSVFIVILDYAC